MLSALLGGIALFFAFRLDRYVTLETLKEHRDALTGWVAAHRAAAIAAYLGVYALVIALSLPVGVFLTLSGGFLFGPLLGTVLAVIGATTGATLVFLAARFIFGEALRARAGPWLSRMEAGFNRNAFTYMIALRLTPVLPFWLVNLVPAFLGVRVATFAAATLIGIIPLTFAFVLVGDGLGAILDAGGKRELGELIDHRIGIALVALALLVLTPPLVRALRARRKG